MGEIVLKGSRVTIKPLLLEDAFKMRSWGIHENPLISDYNFPPLTDTEIHEWYMDKTKPRKNKYYGIHNESHRFIGYLGIKDIKKLKKESTLGLVFDPYHVSNGYGTETLETFLTYYFKELNMNRMYLEVAEFNTRAYKLYVKMGFKAEGYYLDYFFDQKLDLNNPYYKTNESCFVIQNKKIYNYIYRMKLTKDDFLYKKERGNSNEL